MDQEGEDEAAYYWVNSNNTDHVLARFFVNPSRVFYFLWRVAGVDHYQVVIYLLLVSKEENGFVFFSRTVSDYFKLRLLSAICSPL